MLPDFIIVGTQRGGTTSLYNYLTDHPRIAPARVKETHYFTFQYERGIDWYKKLFPRGLRRHITGEASPYYLFHPAVPERVHQVLPDVKLIVLLRDPVARAYSHYRHERKQGEEPLDFDEAVDAEEARLAAETTFDGHAHRHHSYLARGRYAEQLRNWVRFFRLEQMLIVRSEDLFTQPEHVYGEALEYLGAPPHTLREFARYNAGADLEGLAPEVAARLGEYFRPHNEEIYDLVGRDMGWDR